MKVQDVAGNSASAFIALTDQRKARPDQNRTPTEGSSALPRPIYIGAGNDYDESMKHQVSPSALRLTAISAVVLLLVGIAGHFIQAAGSPNSTAAGGGLLRQPIANGNGLVGWWKLDGDAKDQTANHNDGTVTGSPTIVQGKFGNAYKFTDSTQVIDAGHSILSQVDNWTISSWVNVSNFASYSMSAVYNGDDAGGYGFTINPTVACGNIVGRLCGLFGGVCWIDSGYTFASTNQWYHVVMLRTSGTTKFYVNGTQTGKVSSACTPNTVANFFTIGQERGASGQIPYGNFFGSIDDARIYNRALSATEITALYQGSSPANFDQFTKNYYNLDDNSGDAALTHLHQTSASNNGTLTNFTNDGGVNDGWITGKYSRGLKFKPANTDYVSVPSSTAWQGINKLSVCAWGYLSAYDSTDASSIISVPTQAPGTTPSDPYTLWEISINTAGKINFRVSTGVAASRITVTSAATFALNQWNHVCGIYSGSTLSIYYNNSIDTNTTSNNLTIGSNSQPLLIGAFAHTGFPDVWNGSLDDIRIYNTALSATDVSDLYNGKSLASQRSNLVGYWDLDEGNGTTAYDHANDNSALLAPGGSSWTSGNFGSAVTLTASSYGSLSIPDEAMTSGSVEFWINPTTITGDQRLISQASGVSTQAGQLALNQSSGESGSLWVWDGTAWQRLADTGTIGAGVWNHIVVDYSGSSATAFINGIQTYTITTACAFSGMPLSFGGLFLNTTGGYFNGLVDDLRFSSRIIQDYEATEHYRLGV